MANDTLCIPMKLDAFVLNQEVCNRGDLGVKIAPITQPNYTFLRLHDSLIQSDILPHVDIHNAIGSQYNSRITNLESGHTHLHRQGVYLHWMLPRVYRAAASATEDSKLDRDGDGFPDPETNSDPKTKPGTDQTAPQFRPVPTRWLVIRHLRESTPHYGDKEVDMPVYKAWVVESNYQQKVTNVALSQDLQVDMSPFIAAPSDGNVNIKKQAEVFIGKKTPVKKWTEPLTKNAPLTVLNGGNILFPDFQYHNGNVFSILDNFEYQSGKNVKYLESAAVDYFVMGWHASPEEDPFYIERSSKINRKWRLGHCQMVLKTVSKETARMWGEQKKSARTVCHGAMYGVKWNVTKAPENIPADKLCKQLQNSMPVAVGTTPLDSLLAYVRAHQKDEDDIAIKKVMKVIENIQKYLLVQEDTTDGQEQADDLLYTYNYDAASGGKRFHVAGATDAKKPTEKPTGKIVDALALLNQQQARLDSLNRMKQRLRWKLFARWWEHVTRGISDGEGDKLKKHCKTEVDAIMGEWKNLVNSEEESIEEQKTIMQQDATTTKKVKDLIDKKVIDISVHPSFYSQRDPTLLVGHIQSAWPSDWLRALEVRLNTDITTWQTRGELAPGTIRNDVGISKLPKDIQETATALVKEFIDLTPDRIGSQPVPANTIKPLYHYDPEIKGQSRRDEWGDTQPFFPLFLEWEAEYTHIDYSSWSLEQRSATVLGSAKLVYGIRGDDPLWQSKKEGQRQSEKKEETRDQRMLSGRVLILPQPSFSLRSQIRQVFEQTPKDELERALKVPPNSNIDCTKEICNDILKNLDKLTFLTSPLAGFHDHLLTMAQGTHIKPTVRQSGGKLKAITDATETSAGFLDGQFEIMGTETDLTPYGNLVHIPTDRIDSVFKPVTHGQFKFTKLNIIDKFGQVINAFDPRWDAPHRYLRPCLSEYYAPQPLPDGTPNMVERGPEGPGKRESQFAQLPPHINQPARVNCEFVQMKNHEWVPQREWENPIWGWMVYNYLDHAIQFFLKDGTFYREVRIGGGTGTMTSPKWLPFENTGKAGKLSQLDHLISSMANDQYLKAFVHMIQSSLEDAPRAPDAYAQFLNSLVGRPFALVNMGWSLELATDEYKNQCRIDENNNNSKIDDLKPYRSLLHNNSKRPGNLYEFPFQLGDKKRSFDGLVGYFKTLQTPQPEEENYLDLSHCFTFYSVEEEGSPLVKIQPENYPLLEPYFIDPVTNNAAEMERKRNLMLGKNTFGAIIDPFNAVHGYTGILPVQSLKLPTWTWQDAMSRMTAFFHIGPLTVTKDVPPFKSNRVLRTDSDIKSPETLVEHGKIGLPTMGSADWAWLQPYSKEETSSFMPLGLAGADTKPKFEQGPYTTVEGFLQLRRPIVQPMKKV